MANPVLLQTYPADNDTGIPVGISIELYFDRGIDIETAKQSVVLYGRDYDQTSGPDQVMWTDPSTLDNPFYLKSPGFTGVVPLSYRTVYYDLSTQAEIDPGTITSEADEITANVGHKLICTPQEQLAADVQYTLFVMGDPDSLGTGVSARTVFDVVPDPGNASQDGELFVYGSYTRNIADTVVIEITESGDIGTAKYQWYYQSAGISSAVTGRVTSRRYRRLADGLQVRFTGSNFVAGDQFTFNVEPSERLLTNTQVIFTTNDGSFVEAPESPSTPASCEPPETVLTPTDALPGSVYLEILETTPEDRAINVPIDTNEITIVFSEDIDPTTITDETVVLKKISASGEYSDTNPPVILSKTMTVSGNVLTIKF